MPGSFWITSIIVLVHLIVIGLVKFPESCGVLLVRCIFQAAVCFIHICKRMTGRSSCARTARWTCTLPTGHRDKAPPWSNCICTEHAVILPRTWGDGRSCGELSQASFPLPSLSHRTLPIPRLVATRQQSLAKWVKFRPSVSKSLSPTLRLYCLRKD